VEFYGKQKYLQWSPPFNLLQVPFFLVYFFAAMFDKESKIPGFAEELPDLFPDIPPEREKLFLDMIVQYFSNDEGRYNELTTFDEWDAAETKGNKVDDSKPEPAEEIKPTKKDKKLKPTGHATLNLRQMLSEENQSLFSPRDEWDKKMVQLSGPWVGHYVQGNKASNMTVVLFFGRYTITGQGRDNIGPYEWSGSYERIGDPNAEKLVAKIQMTKQYYQKHLVYYSGLLEQDKMSGNWSLETAADKGTFLLSKQVGVAEELSSTPKDIPKIRVTKEKKKEKEKENPDGDTDYILADQ